VPLALYFTNTGPAPTPSSPVTTASSARASTAATAARTP
jgi:hypothetical protein